MVKGLSQIFAAGPAVVDGLGEAYKGGRGQSRGSEGGARRQRDPHPQRGWSMTKVASEGRSPSPARGISSAFMPEYVGQPARRSA